MKKVLTVAEKNQRFLAKRVDIIAHKLQKGLEETKGFCEGKYAKTVFSQKINTFHELTLSLLAKVAKLETTNVDEIVDLVEQQAAQLRSIVAQMKSAGPLVEYYAPYRDSRKVSKGIMVSMDKFRKAVAKDIEARVALAKSNKKTK